MVLNNVVAGNCQKLPNTVGRGNKKLVSVSAVLDLECISWAVPECARSQPEEDGYGS